MSERVLVTGGAGYVGARLVPELLRAGYPVRVVDLFFFGREVLDGVTERAGLECIEGDIRDGRLLDDAMQGIDTVIHLACISNDPSFDLDPLLSKSINLDAFRPLVETARDRGVRRFIYASSSSVYGVKEVEDVREDMSLEPLTGYSKFKAMCEEILAQYQSDEFTTCTIRPATVCGYSPRQRLDVIVNIFTNLAYHKGEITVFGGTQKRPNIHIKDMVRAYLHLLGLPRERIAGKVFNVGCANHSVRQLAEMVRRVVGPVVKLVSVPTDDTRSYHIDSRKIQDKLGFSPLYTIEDAITELRDAFDAGRVPNALSDKRYYNIKTMQALGLK